MKKIWILFMIAIVALSGCTGLGEVDIREVNLKNFKILNTTSANLEFECTVQNPTQRRIILEDINGVLKKGGVVFGRVEMVQADTVAANTLSVNGVMLKVNIEDPLSLLAMGLNISSWNPEEFKVDVRSTIRREGRSKYTIKRKNIPLESLIEAL